MAELSARKAALRSRTQAELDAAVPARKKCRVCREEKSGLDFTQDRNKPDGRDTKCKACSAEEGRRYRAEHPERVRVSKRKSYIRGYPAARRYRLQRLYGLTREQYEALAAEQGGVCAICGQPESSRSNNGSTVKELAVDHCHASGVVRGLLCHCCNQGIGSFKDNIEVLRAAVEYLTRHAKET